MQKKETFPTKADTDGYFFETEDEQEMEIRTKVYENDKKTKTVQLPGGKLAVIRELTGRDTKMIARYQGKDEERYLNACLTVAVTVDGKAEVIEYYEAMKLKSLTKLIAAFSSLNF